MATKERIQEIFDAVLDLPPSEIIGKKIDLTYKAGNYLGICPFHNDHTLGSFVVTDSKNCWKCFACAPGMGITGGNAINFRSRYDNITYFDAAMRIANEEGIISQEEYQQICKKKIPVSELLDIKRSVGRKRIAKKDINMELMQKVYVFLRDHSGLTKKHYEHLKEVRMLTDERIREDYFSFPYQNKNSVTEALLSHLGGAYTMEQLENVPGFFFDREKNRLTYAGYRGIGILLRNASGEIAGIQIRKDVVKGNEPRYVWFSSTFAGKNAEKYRGGNGVGSPLDIVYPKTGKPKYFIGITEGRFKAEKLAEHGDFIGISVQGVGNYAGIEKEIRYLFHESAYGKRLSKTLILFYDADMMGNPQVMGHAIGLSHYIEEQFPGVCVKYAMWHEELGKGIDDLIINENESDISYVDSGDVEVIYNAILKAVLAAFELNKVSELKREQLPAFYEKVKESLTEVFF